MRFHCGISFSWRTIKKYILPFGIGLLAYLGFNGIFDYLNLGFINVYAYENFNTSYNISFDDYNSQLENESCNDVSLLDYFDYIISNVDFSTSYYQVFVNYVLFDDLFDIQNPSLYVYLIPTSSIQNDYIQYRGTNNGNQVNAGGNYAFNISPYYNTYQYYFVLRRFVGTNGVRCYLENGSPIDTDVTGHIIDFIQNNHYIYENNVNNFTIGITRIQNSTYASFFETTNTQINNNSSYNTSLWYYYSSVKYRLNPLDNSSSTFWYYKNINIIDKNIIYTKGDYISSYYELYPRVLKPTFIGYQTELNTFYTNLQPNQLSNYQLKVDFKVPQSILGFYQTPQEYIDNTSFEYICSGRVNSGDYYYYESFPCSLSSSYTTTSNTITYTFNNVSYTQNISNYDEIFVTIIPKYNDSGVSTTVFNLNYTFTNGYFYNTSFKGAIYERLSGLLTLDFKLYFSSNNSPNNANLYIDTTTFDNTIYSLGFSNTSHNEFYQIGQSILGNPNSYEILDHFRLTRVSNSFDTGIMVFQQNGSTRIPYLNLFFNGGMYISQNLGNDTFYYIDSNGSIQNGSFSPPLINQNDEYNVSSYLSIVNDFIDSMSESSAQFGLITQNFYDSMPPFFQTFIFVVFILFCLLFTYLLIKRK